MTEVKISAYNVSLPFIAIYAELLNLRDTIVAYAVVSYRKETETVVIAEQIYIGSDYDFQMFDNLTHAQVWINSVVKQVRNKTVVSLAFLSPYFSN